MSAFSFGEPHSLRRYIEFGIVAGILAGTLALVFDANLTLVSTVAAVVAGVLAGRTWSPNTEALLTSNGARARKTPMFAAIAVTIVVISLALAKCGGVMVPTPWN